MRSRKEIATNEFATRRLGKDDSIIHTRTMEQLCQASDAMVAQARATVRILSHDTEPALYNRDEFIEPLARLISQRSRVARIRILIADPKLATLGTHRLIALWHRFPSFVSLRELRDEYTQNREAFLVVDEQGLIRRPDYTLPDAVVCFSSVSTAANRAAWFDEAFERGAESIELRRIHL